MRGHLEPSPERGKRHYLVTGGCGFIGSHLVDALVEEGHAVTILDDLSTGKRENANPRAKLIVGDTSDYATVEQAMQDVSGVFHLAAVASVERSVNDWAKTHTVNLTSTVNIFQAASRQAKKPPVVYTSSAAIYGKQDEPITEDILTWPLTAYGVDKLGCDLHARVAWEIHRVPVMGVRPFNIYGPRQDPQSPYSGVISIFADRIQRHLPITIFGDGEQVRDFVYVADTVKVFQAAMRQLRDGFDIVNICTGRATSVNDLVDVLEGIIGWAVPQQHQPPRQGDIRTSIGDPTHLVRKLNLTLNTTLEDGLRRLIQQPITTQEAA
jgi:UDP-glucose 4-epimerase